MMIQQFTVTGLETRCDILVFLWIFLLQVLVLYLVVNEMVFLRPSV